MKKGKYVLFVTIFSTICSAAYTNESPYHESDSLFTSQNHNRLLDPYYEPFEETEKTPLSLSTMVIFLSPQSGFVPSPELAPGLRIGGSFDHKWVKTGLDFFCYKNSSTDKFPLEEYPGIDLKVSRNLTILDYEATVSKPFTLDSGFVFEPLLGLEYASIKRSVSASAGDVAIWKDSRITKLTGIGPMAGIKVYYPIFKNLNLVGSLTRSLLLNKSSFFEEKRTGWTPVTKLRTGLNLAVGESHEKFFSVSGGYEGQYWENELLIFNGVFSEQSNLGMHGFFFEAKMNF